MSTLALTLHEPDARKVRALWAVLEQRLGLRGVRKVPFPHVTLFGCDGVETPRIQEILEDYSHRTGPIDLSAVGLGIFLKPSPVLYLPVIRTPRLTAIHQHLWHAVGALGAQRFPLYNLERWIPHMTLAQGDLRAEQLPEALNALRDAELELRFQVRNLTIFDFIGPRFEPAERYPLLGEPITS